MRSFFIFMLLVSVAVCGKGAKNSDWKIKTENAEYAHRAIKLMTDVMVHDIYSPPVASRTYAYISVAGYEAARFSDPAYVTLATQLNGLKEVPKPEAGKEYSFALASVQAILTVGKALVVSEKRVNEFYNSMLQEFKSNGMPEDVFSNSVAYGQAVAKHILDWAALDNYKQTRTMPRYALSNAAATWKPTPPSYLKAVEPNWNKIRPFLIDSAQQFKPVPANKFSTEKNSPFFKEAVAVYEAGKQLTTEQREMANFWDCNPYKMNINGHVMCASKKISPGGHWMNITRLICRKSSASLVKSLEAYASLSVTIADASISCWDEKYRSNSIRPETYINKYIDGSWSPLLQTPPFPEYTSGHSVLSSAAAVMLEKLFGNNFSFSDSTEVEFGIPVRHFKSLKAAADEAAVSRFYGGIHYMNSIDNGADEGKAIGLFAVTKLKTTHPSPSPISAAGVDNNVIHLADPTIFPFQNKYYLYGTVEGGSTGGFLVYISDDLKTWKLSEKNNGFALKKGDVFGEKGFWAPQVFYYRKKFYMAYVANEEIAIAVSDSPDGPFLQKNKVALPSSVKQIDPFIFMENGKIFLYHVRLINGNRIFVAELNDDLTAIKEGSLRERISSALSWENTQNATWPVAEGPSVLKRGKFYYLFYSSNDFRNPDYAVGYATSESPVGPWKKYEGNPVLGRKLTGQDGSGHGDFFQAHDKQWYYVFHTHNAAGKVSPRKTALVKVGFDKAPGTSKEHFAVSAEGYVYLSVK